MRTFSPDELSACDGREGAPSYIAYEGKVYDVGESFLWRRGRHMVTHLAGRDLTAALAEAPHGPELLEGFPVVGTLPPGL